MLSCGWRSGVNDIDRVWRIDSNLRALRPEAGGLLDLANLHAWLAVQPIVLELIRLKVGSLIGNKAGLLRRSRTARAGGLTESKIAQLGVYYKSNDYSAVEKQILSFTESFVIDVGSIIEADVAGLENYFSVTQLNELVVALYVTECTQRLEMLVPALVADSNLQASDIGVAADQEILSSRAPTHAEDLVAVLERYQEAVVQGRDLDPVITELVRLRCARTHDCRICKTLRLVDAREAGVDDAMTAKIDFYERSDLDERIKIALRITDAFITRPDTLKESVSLQARAMFTPEALVELCLDITKWSTQKIYVAQGTDGAHALPKNEQGVSFFSFDEGGKVTGFTATPG